MTDSNTQNFAYHEGRTFGKYILESMVGRGGMAEVYKSRHPDLDREVAIKILHPYLTDTTDFVERFRREARAAAALRHPNIIQIFDFDVTDDGLYYMVMEFIDGESFDAYLQQQNGPVPEAKSLELYQQICGALQVAHERGIVHRDIKPANIMLDKQQRPYIGDFGIAQIVGDTRLTQSGMTSGTPQYMSPEQVTGDEISPATDIYAMGIMLYRLMSGRLPFEGGNPATVMMNHVTEPPERPSLFAPDLSPAIESVILKAIAKEPSDRFQDAAELGSALEAAAGSGTAVAIPTSPTKPEAVAAAAATLQQTAVTPEPPATIITETSRTPTWVWPVLVVGALALVAVGFLLARGNGNEVEATAVTNATTDNELTAADTTGTAVTSPGQPALPAAIPGMVFIPSTTFMMGNNEGNSDERPEHEVTVDGFFIDETEVTNEAYAEFVSATNRDLPAAWQQPEPSVWEVTAAEPFIAGNHEDRFMFDGADVQPATGSLSMTLDADNEVGLVTAVFTGTIEPNPGQTLSGEFRVEQHTFSPGPTNPAFQEGGIGDFVRMHGQSGMELMQYPEMVAYIGTWGAADVFLDDELLYDDVGIHIMYSDGVRDDAEQFVFDGNGRCCFDPSNPADSSLDENGREISVWVFPGSSQGYSYDYGDDALAGETAADEPTWFAVYYNQVTEIKAPAFTGPTSFPEGEAEHPVGGVSWDDAVAYCEWRDGRLPTEAEWELAARGQDGLLYPWGNESGEQANYADWNDATLPVGSFPDSNSPFGLLDMAGNVWEWTADWYSPTYYADSPADNPSGPETGEVKVARGGGFRLLDILGLDEARSTHRLPLPPDVQSADVGFRCAATVDNVAN